MIWLERNVPPVYPSDSRDFQVFLRAYNFIFNMVKQDTDTLRYLTDTELCESKILPLLKTKLGFFTNYPINDDMLRGILAGFPSMVKNKGSIEAIQQAVNIFLKVLNIKAEIVIKVVGAEAEIIKGGIEVDDHTILIAINSAIQNFYILEELFKYIMPVGYQYDFYFYRELDKESWLINKHTGKFLIVSNLMAQSIRDHNFYNQDFGGSYMDPNVDHMINQVNTIELYRGDYEEFVLVPLTFEPHNFQSDYYYFYKIVNNKYVQLTQAETYQENTYYIPRFTFINQTENYEYEQGKFVDYKPVNVYPGTNMVEYYFDYYEKGSDGVYRNLQAPLAEEDFEVGKYFEPVTQKVRAIADDVISYADIPITATYISTLASFNN